MLLSWYRRWRLKKTGALFRYYNGRKIVWADVLTLYRKIIHHQADIVSLLPAVDSQQEPETTQFLEAITEIFGLTRAAVRVNNSPGRVRPGFFVDACLLFIQ